jgi:uncharacterized protein YcbK (DUF882 family)
MGDLSKNFSRSEFKCSCGCGYDDVSLELVSVLQKLREVFNAPVTINSACRCKGWNKEVGGAEKSQHLLGTAADIVVSDVPPALIYQYLDRSYPESYGIGKYKSFTHIDVRQRRGRWG